jgi:hypothetical protein
MAGFFTLGRKLPWPDSPALMSKEKTCWVEFKLPSPKQKPGGAIVGPECRSLGDLEDAIKQIKLDLDAVAGEARHYFGSSP